MPGVSSPLAHSPATVLAASWYCANTLFPTVGLHVLQYNAASLGQLVELRVLSHLPPIPLEVGELTATQIGGPSRQPVPPQSSRLVLVRSSPQSSGASAQVSVLWGPMQFIPATVHVGLDGVNIIQ